MRRTVPPAPGRSDPRAPLAGWSLGVLVADRALAGHLGLPLETRFVTSSGGIDVAFEMFTPR